MLGSVKLYSEKATKFCEIFSLLLTLCTAVKSKGKILQNFVAFSEYMNFMILKKIKCESFKRFSLFGHELYPIFQISISTQGNFSFKMRLSKTWPLEYYFRKYFISLCQASISFLPILPDVFKRSHYSESDDNAYWS